MATALLYEEKNRERAASAVGVAIFHALLGYALLTSFGFDPVRQVSEQLKMFEVNEEPPPPPVKEAVVKKPVKAKPKTKDPEGAASPANLRNTPAEIVAPKPVDIVIPPPVIAAPIAAQGSAPAAGAANVPGPGTGAGGQGTGRGSGLEGNGTGGGGGGGGLATEARWIRGRIEDRDYPRSALEAEASGTVHLRFVVQPDGRVSGCRVTRSSGNRDLDFTTCRLIEQRFRYRPARDASGRPIAQPIVGQHRWDYSREPDEPAEEEE
jgi:protein TonB